VRAGLNRPIAKCRGNPSLARFGGIIANVARISSLARFDGPPGSGVRCSARRHTFGSAARVG